LNNEAAAARRLEAEGFYVGRKPYVTKKNRSLMENRLARFLDNIGLKWFGQDGEIVALPDPIKYVSTRPPINPSFYVSIGAEYHRARYLRDFAQNVLEAERGSNSLNSINIAKYRIDLDVNQVKFHFHHLFSAEHVLAFRLASMYKHYKITTEQNLIEIFTAKVLYKLFFNSIKT
jgi:coiled-coil and C2 domain-containing protein 2A